jgi:multidrug efflux pump subunit AcrA (membrane-fusion protein)
VLRLTSEQPRSLVPYTGTVSSWKTDQVGFQVGGRIESLVEPGTNIEGATFDENGEPLSEGTVIAVLESERFEFQLQSAIAGMNTAIAKRDASDSELNNVLPQQIEAAEARQELAQTQFNRTQQLVADGAAAQVELDRIKASLDVATADLQSLLETRAIKEAERAGFQAQVDEAQEAVRNAEKDLADTVLRSPYDGQVAEVHQILGGVVQPGQAVCTIQMMDPIAIEVQVSARQDALLNYNDSVRVFPPGADAPQLAMVYEKAALADPATRTYAVTLLLRNDLLRIGFPEDFDGENDVRVRNIWPIFAETTVRRPPYYVSTDALFQDDTGFYVWRAKGLSRDQFDADVGPRVEVEKVPIIPGDRRISFPGVATLREISDLGEIDPEADMVVGAPQQADGSALAAGEAARRLESRGYAYFVRDRWNLRPGDVVQVELQGAEMAEGFYLPMNAVSQQEDGAFVFAVPESEGTSTVTKVEVTVTPVAERPEFVLIAPVSEGALHEGSQIVTQGVHYLVDGEAVRVVTTVEAGS